MYVLSHFQAKEILDQYAKLDGDGEISCSLDLGITRSTILKKGNDFLFPDGQRIMVKLITKILGNMKVCFGIEEERIFPLHTFSEENNRFYKLLPTGLETPPTIELSGIRMHVTKEMDPGEDTRRKILEVSPVEGIVVDTCRGLGYTTIAAAKAGAKKVVSFENDVTVTEVAKYNPHSKELFTLKNLELINGDASKKIKGFKSKSVDRVIHDPPTLALAGELYSQTFYNHVYRVLVDGGILYHYTGKPGSKKRGMNLPKSVSERLKKAGFQKVVPAHYGVKAMKIKTRKKK